MKRKIKFSLAFYFFFVVFYGGSVFGADEVEKTVCLSLLNQESTDIRNSKQKLLLLAKREAVGKVFGECISSFSGGLLGTFSTFKLWAAIREIGDY